MTEALGYFSIRQFQRMGHEMNHSGHGFIMDRSSRHVAILDGEGEKRNATYVNFKMHETDLPRSYQGAKATRWLAVDSVEINTKPCLKSLFKSYIRR